MKKIVCVVGARPQFIKHFPLEIELNKFFQIISIHTGQHYDAKMSQIFFDELKISIPSYQLKLNHKSHGGQTAEMLHQIEEILIEEQPDAMLVYGDTNSTIAGALAAAKLNIPVIHVEAGLRSYNKKMPEEINRIVTDHISALLFCSSEVGLENLVKEGISNGVHVCGDLMKDAQRVLIDSLKIPDNTTSGYVFTTLHRPYNTDDYSRLSSILDSLNDLNSKVIFPVHPRTRKMLNDNGFKYDSYSNISFIDPVGYIESLSYQKYSDCVITDSGGIQKEAYWLQKKCITLRSETEWVETGIGDWNELIFENLSDIKQALNKKPVDELYNDGLYGNGNSASAITQVILNHLK